jgi:hypothetical protein
VRSCLVVVVSVVALGCGRGRGASRADSPLLHAPPPPAPIDVAKARKDPDELVRAASAPVGAPHRLHGTHQIKVSEGDAVTLVMSETTSVDEGAGGAFHASYANDHDYGRDVFFDGTKLWLRPRYGKFHRRLPVDPDEPARLERDVAGTFAADLELVSR